MANGKEVLDSLSPISWPGFSCMDRPAVGLTMVVPSKVCVSSARQLIARVDDNTVSLHQVPCLGIVVGEQ